MQVSQCLLVMIERAMVQDVTHCRQQALQQVIELTHLSMLRAGLMPFAKKYNLRNIVHHPSLITAVRENINHCTYLYR